MEKANLTNGISFIWNKLHYSILADSFILLYTTEQLRGKGLAQGPQQWLRWGLNSQPSDQKSNILTAELSLPTDVKFQT